MILLGDSLEVLKTLDANSIDSCVTDPPYGLKFMSKHWDYDVPKVELWHEVFRVLKPGAHALIACGTRTQHRMVAPIEDAGFEVRDVICHHYGSGFPKSMDVSKAIDKAAGADREVGAPQLRPDGTFRTNIVKHEGSSFTSGSNDKLSTRPSTDDAKQWQGWGTALKPATEFWTLVRKPLSENTVAANVLKHGTGAINIDASRIGDGQGVMTFERHAGNRNREQYRTGTCGAPQPSTQGRWPANLILSCTCGDCLDGQMPLFHEDGCAVKELDEQSGTLRARGNKSAKQHIGDYKASSYKFGNRESGFTGDSGGASRFFYIAKSSKRDRSSNGAVNNIHPTCKPTKLMEYLIKLITPPNGTVLDCFAGSGSTGVAAANLGFKFIGIEREAEYAAIAEKRIEHALG